MTTELKSQTEHEIKSERMDKAIYQADLIEAANTPMKRKFIKNEISLDTYLTHERNIYGVNNENFTR